MMLLSCVFLLVAGSFAQTSTLPTIKPNIFLSDPIDAYSNAGLDDHPAYCIDIFGRPGSNTCDNKSPEARSCRLAGEDTQFEYDAATSAIKATNYDTYCSGGSGPCLEVSSIAADATVTMKACDASAKQTFAYTTTDCQLTVGGFCLVVQGTINIASGLKRPMFLADCSTIEAARREWTVVTTDTATITACSAGGTAATTTSATPATATTTSGTATTSATTPAGTTSTAMATGASMTTLAALVVARFF